MPNNVQPPSWQNQNNLLIPVPCPIMFLSLAFLSSDFTGVLGGPHSHNDKHLLPQYPEYVPLTASGHGYFRVICTQNQSAEAKGRPRPRW